MFRSTVVVVAQQYTIMMMKTMVMKLICDHCAILHQNLNRKQQNSHRKFQYRKEHLAQRNVKYVTSIMTKQTSFSWNVITHIVTAALYTILNKPSIRTKKLWPVWRVDAYKNIIWNTSKCCNLTLI